MEGWLMDCLRVTLYVRICQTKIVLVKHMNKPSKKEIINSTKPLKKRVDLKINGRRVEYVVTRKGVGHLITKFGIFLLYNFHIDDKWEEYMEFEL